MRIRGDRECKSCGARWSYYETGSITCPECGSAHSVGIAERKLHTSSPVDFDLHEARTALESSSIETVARQAAEAAGTFVRKSGFVHAGELRPLDETFVAATELSHAGTEIARSLRITDPEKAYFLALLEGAESGERPPPGEVPDSMTTVRGLAATAAVADYRRDIRRYLEQHPDEEARQVLGLLEDHRTRIEALDGEVAPRKADAVIEAAQAVGTYLTEDGVTLQTAHERLEALDPDHS